MKDVLPHKPSPENPDSGQETWLSKEEVMKRYNVSDRQLEYWRRDRGKIRYKKINHLTYYVESEIQEQVKLLARPKKFIFIRKNLIGEKLRTIDPPLVLLLVAACLLLANGFQNTEVLLAWLIYNWAPVFLIATALLWYLIRLIIYFYKRYFEKDEKDR
jgi:hypothetical protein